MSFKSFKHWYYEIGESSAAQIARDFGVTYPQIQLWLNQLHKQP